MTLAPQSLQSPSRNQDHRQFQPVGEFPLVRSVFRVPLALQPHVAARFQCPASAIGMAGMPNRIGDNDHNEQANNDKVHKITKKQCDTLNE